MGLLLCGNFGQLFCGAYFCYTHGICVMSYSSTKTCSFDHQVKEITSAEDIVYYAIFKCYN